MVRRTVPTAAVTLGAAALLSAVMTTASAAPPPATTTTAATTTATSPAAASPAITVSVTAGQALARHPHPVNRPVLVDCFWHARVRPTDFMLACGDGNSRLASLHWLHWGEHSAMARGVNWVNDCKPYCAAGKFHPYRVTVRLDHAERWKRHPRLEQFTRMRLYYPADRPESYKRVMTLSLWS
jgi:hypothetical protein